MMRHCGEIDISEGHNGDIVEEWKLEGEKWGEK